jgi:hypothetical protein
MTEAKIVQELSRTDLLLTEVQVLTTTVTTICPLLAKQILMVNG